LTQAEGEEDDRLGAGRDHDIVGVDLDPAITAMLGGARIWESK
jgi:hypothetical protein